MPSPDRGSWLRLPSRSTAALEGRVPRGEGGVQLRVFFVASPSTPLPSSRGKGSPARTWKRPPGLPGVSGTAGPVLCRGLRGLMPRRPRPYSGSTRVMRVQRLPATPGSGLSRARSCGSPKQPPRPKPSPLISRRGLRRPSMYSGSDRATRSPRLPAKPGMALSCPRSAGSPRAPPSLKPKPPTVPRGETQSRGLRHFRPMPYSGSSRRMRFAKLPAVSGFWRGLRRSIFARSNGSPKVPPAPNPSWALPDIRGLGLRPFRPMPYSGSARMMRSPKLPAISEPRVIRDLS